MSIQLIQNYYTKVEQIIRYGGSRNESSLRKPFQDLLEQYARVRNLEREIVLVDEEIDRRVYVLYGLSPEEIRLVDGKG